MHITGWNFCFLLGCYEKLLNVGFQQSSTWAPGPCCCSVAKSCPALCDFIDCSTPGLPVLHCLLEFAQTHVHWVSDAIQPSHMLASPYPPAFSLSQHQSLSNKSALRIRWPKDWSFSFSVSPSNEYSGLISFRIHWLNLLAVQGTLKSLLQHHCSKASILQWSAFSIVQLSHPYMTTRKTITLTIRTFVGKEISLLFNTLLLIGLSLLFFQGASVF